MFAIVFTEEDDWRGGVTAGKGGMYFVITFASVPLFLFHPDTFHWQIVV